MKKRLKDGISISALLAIAVLLSVAVSLLSIVSVSSVVRTCGQNKADAEKYDSAESTVSEFSKASNYLSEQANAFALTLTEDHANRFLEELYVTRRRESAVLTLKTADFSNQDAVSAIEEAFSYSNQLVKIEKYSVCLTASAAHIENSELIERLDVAVSDEDNALSDTEKLEKSRELLSNESYYSEKNKLNSALERCVIAIQEAAEKQEKDAQQTLSFAASRQTLLTVFLFAVIILTVILFSVLVYVPMRQYLNGMKKSEPIPEKGVNELRRLARAYNKILAENKKSTELLRHAAEHDGLTRLFNRRAFETFREQLRDEIAFLIIDIDFFKRINDTFGHDVGDKILQKTARLLKSSFRSSDIICRMGGDEFTIIMKHMTPELCEVIESKVDLVKAGLADTSDGLPPATVSVGASFGGGESAEEIFKAADNALYNVKERGGNGMSFSINGEMIPV